MTQSYRKISIGGPLTPAMKWIMINIALVWIVQLLLAHLERYTPFHRIFALHLTWVLEGKVWQVVTYMFLHDVQSPFHIILNLVILYMFGGQMELRWGSKNFVFYFLLCGLSGALAVLLWSAVFPLRMATIGASGAILGILAAYCLTWPERSIYLLGVLPLKGKHLLLITVGIDFLFFIVPADNRISFQAHMGGLICGVLLTTGYWHPRKIKQRLRIWLLKRKHSKKKKNPNDIIRGPWLH